MGPRQRLRLGETRKSDDFDDQKSAAGIAGSEGSSADLAEFQNFLLSQVKRIIHGDASGNWHDDFITAFGGDASLKGLFANSSERPFITDFDWSDVGAGELTMGLAPADTLVQLVLVEILDPFDGGTAITVGDAVAQGRFHAIADNNPEFESIYQSFAHYEYLNDTEIKIFFPAGAPTTGS
ncbi:MAG: hypothetical protein JSW58_07410, partial [Candidatus Latescibacterota bacterium]